jgi:hypothetical protein
MVWIENKAPFQGCVYKGTLVHHPEANQLFPLEEAVKGTLGELGFSCFYESSSISKEDVDIMAGVGVGVLKKSSFSKIAFNLEREGHSCLCLVYPLIEEEGVVKYVVHVESLGIKETFLFLTTSFTMFVGDFMQSFKEWWVKLKQINSAL